MTDAKREAKQCDDLARTMGYTVSNLEQRRASNIALGLSDRRYQGKHAFFFELKFGADRLTLEQCAFLTRERHAGALASCGGLQELTDLLSALQRAPLASAQSLCDIQIEEWADKGFRGGRTVRGAE